MTVTNRPDQQASPTFYLDEEVGERRSLRLATLAALIVHGALFLVTFPELGQRHVEARSPEVFVVRPIPFKPQPVDPQPTAPPEPTRRIPIPDPTPDDPEPLLPALPETPALMVPSDLVAIGLLPPPPPPVDTGPVRFDSRMVHPQRISGAEPRYTEIARRARIEGVVVLLHLRPDVVGDGNAVAVQVH